MKKHFFAVIFAFSSIILPPAFLAAQNSISYKGSGNYTFTERTDLRRYDNGKYTGLLSREIRSFIVQKENLYDGNFYVWQETRRNMQRQLPGINDAIPSVFKIASDGTFTMLQDNGYPTFRSFPCYPQQKISKGEKWTASSVRVVDPMNTGEFTRIPFTAEYTYLKDDVYNGTEVYIVSAKWATRYGFLSAAEVPADTEGDPLLDRATGSHSATIAISKESGAALVVRDTVDESFFYKDGRRVDFKGTISLFTNYPPAVDRKKIITSVKKEKLPAEEVPVEETPAGLKISIKNLQFKPDSDQLLESEKERLDKIASVLLNAKDSSFLVEGHTASTGNPSGEMSLSIKRARAIASELSKRGIPAEKFICKGWGATKPIADNSTPEGMAQNRRVEITILE